MNKLPALRNENIVVQELDAEILLFDLKNNQAYSLNETSAKVYRACGNEITIEELKRRTHFTDELIHLTLEKMQKANLLIENINYADTFNSVNRREIIKRIALSSTVTLPVISSIVIPTAANAASNPVNASCGGTATSPCPRIDCEICCDGGLYDIIIVNRCPTCRCLGR
jgi:hypothetical protein